jgi:hypothetical protein
MLLYLGDVAAGSGKKRLLELCVLGVRLAEAVPAHPFRLLARRRRQKL